MSDGYTLAEGQRVGPWTLVRSLGRGGFSEVWHARRELPARPTDVALKVLLHAEHVAQLRAEANAFSLARGRGIVRVHALDLAADPPWLALELLDGGDLRARLAANGGRLLPVRAIELFRKLVAILARVHEAGVVHGDLKPENVLFERGKVRREDEATVLVGDFGLSRRIAQRTASLSVSVSLADTRLAGTLDYMAPEQRAGERPTPRSDVFALGVLFYELLVGERPQGAFALPGEKLTGIPPVVDHVLARALAANPADRFADAGELAETLNAGLSSGWHIISLVHRDLGEHLFPSLAPKVGKVVGVIAFLVFVPTCGLGSVIRFDPRASRSDKQVVSFLDGAFTGLVVSLLLGLALYGWARVRERALRRLTEELREELGAHGVGPRRR